MAPASRPRRSVVLAAAAALLAALAVLPLLFAKLGDHGLRGDEGFYGLVVHEMLEREDWSRLRLEGEPFVNKPPLAFWAMAASARALGLREATLRLPGALASTAVAAIVFAIGLRRVGPAGALLATLLTISAPHALRFHGWRGAVTEPWLTLYVLLALLAATRLEDRRRRRLALGALAVAGALAKGLVGPGLVALALLATALACRAVPHPEPAGARAAARRAADAAIVTLLPAAATFLAWWLWNRPSLEAFAGFLRRDWLARAGGTLQASHLQPWTYFPAQLADELGGWLLLGLAAYAPSRLRELVRRLDLEGVALALFPLVTLVVFTLPASKIAWYLYPAYPALCLTLVEGGAYALRRLGDRRVAIATVTALVLALAGARSLASFRALESAPPNSLVRLARFVEARPGAEVWVDARLGEPGARPREWNRFTLEARLRARSWDPATAPPAGGCTFLVTADRAAVAHAGEVAIAPQARSRTEPPLVVLDRCGGAWARTARRPRRDPAPEPR